MKAKEAANVVLLLLGYFAIDLPTLINGQGYMGCRYFESPLDLTATGVMQTIRIPAILGQKYLPNQHCVWNIRTENRDDVIHLFINKHDLEGLNSQDLCGQDYLEFFEVKASGEQVPKGRFCGQNYFGTLVKTSSSRLEVHFVSGRYYEYGGFDMTFKAERRKSEDPKDNTAVALGVGISVGVISIIVSIIIVVYFYRRWFTPKHSPRSLPSHNPDSSSSNPYPYPSSSSGQCQRSRTPPQDEDLGPELMADEPDTSSVVWHERNLSSAQIDDHDHHNDTVVVASNRLSQHGAEEEGDDNDNDSRSHAPHEGNLLEHSGAVNGNGNNQSRGRGAGGAGGDHVIDLRPRLNLNYQGRPPSSSTLSTFSPATDTNSTTVGGGGAGVDGNSRYSSGGGGVVSGGDDNGSGRNRTPPPSYEFTVMYDRLNRQAATATILPLQPPDYDFVVKENQLRNSFVDTSGV